MELTVLARFPKLMLERADAAGLDRHALERASGLVQTDLADPDARIPTSKLRRLWREIIKVVPDPLLGLKFGSSVRTRDLGLVGYIMAASPTLGHALECLARYGRILADDIQIVLRPDTDTVDLEISAPLELTALRQPVASRLASLLAIARELTESDLHPVSARLPQELPGDSAPYRDYFRAVVQFQAGSAGLTFRARDLELPIPAADRALSHYLEDYARGLLKKLPVRDSLLSRIWRILMARLPAGDPGVEAVADTLGVNVRALQRDLKAKGTTYRDLRDSFRRTTACRLLQNRRIPIKEIAFLLGYQDLGAFYRAFRRWELCSPAQYRAGHTSD